MTGPTLLGTLTGISIPRYYLRLLPIRTLTPVAMPEILLGVSLLLFFNLVSAPGPVWNWAWGRSLPIRFIAKTHNPVVRHKRSALRRMVGHIRQITLR